jgi:hypothetical protein
MRPQKAKRHIRLPVKLATNQFKPAAQPKSSRSITASDYCLTIGKLYNSAPDHSQFKPEPSLNLIRARRPLRILTLLQQLSS